MVSWDGDSEYQISAGTESCQNTFVGIIPAVDIVYTHHNGLSSLSLSLFSTFYKLSQVVMGGGDRSGDWRWRQDVEK